MNQFFLTHGNAPFALPNSAYARFDQAEPVGLDDAEGARFVFSAVSADWFVATRHPSVDLASSEVVVSWWSRYWRRMFGGGDDAVEASADAWEPFDDVPLLRYEVDLRLSRPEYAQYAAASAAEETWFHLLNDPGSPVEAQVFGNLFQLAASSSDCD